MHKDHLESKVHVNKTKKNKEKGMLQTRSYSKMSVKDLLNIPINQNGIIGKRPPVVSLHQELNLYVFGICADKPLNKKKKKKLAPSSLQGIGACIGASIRHLLAYLGTRAELPRFLTAHKSNQDYNPYYKCAWGSKRCSWDITFLLLLICLNIAADGL